MQRALGLILLCLAGLVNLGAAATLALGQPAKLRADVAAFPKIIAPADPAQRRINATLAGLDADVVRNIKECRSDTRGTPAFPGYWNRSIAVTMAGPRFLSFAVSDDVDCGGAHPNAATWPVVFDLETGASIDWLRFLPPKLAGAVTRQKISDGGDTFASPRLHALYLAGYSRGAAAADCREAMAQSDDAPVTLWPDAKTGGLAVTFEVPHVIEACATPVIVPLARLKAEGVGDVLLSAIAAAHRAR